MNRRHANSRPDQMSTAISRMRRTGCPSAGSGVYMCTGRGVAAAIPSSHLALSRVLELHASSLWKGAQQHEDLKYC